MIIWLWALIGVGLMFGLTVFRGAPYVPVHKQSANLALDALQLPANSLVVDLGSGSGTFLRVAAQRNLQALGYEINPILCLISWLNCYRYRKRVKTLWRDFWLIDLPKDTAAVFVFGDGMFMPRIIKKIEQAAKQQHFYLISYGFEIPGKKLYKNVSGMLIYKF